jgi:hypothetical protein
MPDLEPAKFFGLAKGSVPSTHEEFELFGIGIAAHSVLGDEHRRFAKSAITYFKALAGLVTMISRSRTSTLRSGIPATPTT